MITVSLTDSCLSAALLARSMGSHGARSTGMAHHIACSVVPRAVANAAGGCCRPRLSTTPHMSTKFTLVPMK